MAANVTIGLDLDKSRFDSKMREAFKDYNLFVRNGADKVMQLKIDYGDLENKSKLKRAFTKLKKQLDAEWQDLMSSGFKTKSGSLYDFSDFSKIENEFFRLQTKQRKSKLVEANEISMFEKLSAVMATAAKIGTEYNKVAERREKLRRGADNSAKLNLERKEARATSELVSAQKKVIETTKQIARERTRHARGGGQWLSSIYRQINLYHDLEIAAKKAGDAQRATYARNQITVLNKRADAIERVNTLFGRQGRIVSGLTSLAARYFSVYQVANFAKKVAETTGYFQQQQVALEGILGSASKASSVLNEIKSFALQSPFQTKELVTFTKQLSAFGVDSDKLFPTVKSLADISAGLGVEMSRLILAYGQVKSAAVLRGQELRQFTEAGIPLVKKLADKFTDLNGKLVTTGEVFKLISERKVPFEMVASVLEDMTKEGGQFYKMQENITNTTYGQIQKLKDVWTITLDEIGKSVSPVIDSVISGLQNIVRNIKPIAATIASMVLGRGLGKMAESISRIVRAFKAANTAARLFGRGMITSLAGIGGMVLGAIVAKIVDIVQKSKELDRAMAEVSNSFRKDTQKMYTGLDSLAKKITETNVGTKKYSDAVATLAANYSDFVSKDKIEALKGTGDAAIEAARGFNVLVESIKEAIRQRNTYLELEEQGNIAGGKAREKATDTSKQKNRNNGFVTRADILSEYKYANGVTSAYIQEMPGITSFLKKNPGLTHDALRDAIAGVIGNAVEEAAQEGIEYSDRNKLTEHIMSAIRSVYALDDETIHDITARFFSLGGIDEKTYKTSLEKYAAANATIYAQINEPFRRVGKKISEGNYDKKYSNVIDDKISIEQDTAELWRDALKEAFERANLTGYDTKKLKLGKEEKTLKEIVNDSSKSAHDIQVAISKFEDGLDSIEKGYLSQIATNYQGRVPERSGHSERIYNAFTNPNSAVYKWRTNEKLKSIVSKYGNPNDETFKQLQDDLRKEIKDVESHIKEIDSIPGGPGAYAQERADLQEQLKALYLLRGGRFYGTGVDTKSTGKSGNWSGFYTRFANWIKEAYNEQKKLVEGPAGYTEQLGEDIKKLVGTAIYSFYQEGKSPFDPIVEDIKKYALETNIMDEKAQEELLKITNEFKKAEGSAIPLADFERIAKKFISFLSTLGDAAKAKGNKDAAEKLKTGATNLDIDFKKFFGSDKVESLIEKQLKELQKINSHLAMTEKMQSAYNRLYKTETDYQKTYNSLGYEGDYKSFSALSDIITSIGTMFNPALQSEKDGKKPDVQSAINGLYLKYKDSIDPIIKSGEVELENVRTLYHLIDDIKNEQGVEGIGAEPFKNAQNLIISILEKLLESFITQQEKNAQAVGQEEKANLLVNDIRKRRIDRGVDLNNFYDELIRSGEDKDKVNEARDNSIADATIDAFKEILTSLGGTLNEAIARGMKQAGSNTGMSGFGEVMQFMQGGLTDKIAMGTAMGVADGSMSGAEATQMMQGANMAVAIIDMIFKAIDQIFKVVQDILKEVERFDKYVFDYDASNTTRDEYGNVNNPMAGARQAKANEMNAAFNVANSFNDNAQKGWSSAKEGDAFGGLWYGFFKQVLDLPMNIMEAMDQKWVNKIDELKRSNENLQRVIDGLAHQLNDMAGIDKLNNLTEQIAKLREQQANANSMYAAELAKKASDEDAVQEYSDLMQQYQYQAEDLVRSIREGILKTADDVATTLTDALVDAFKNGENAARAWRDTVRNYVSDVLKDVLLERVMAPRVDKILKAVGITEGNTDADSILSIFKDTNKMTWLRDALQGLGTEAIDMINAMDPALREMLFWTNSTSELSGGIQSITEDTARTLEGLSNSMLAQLVMANQHLLLMSQSPIANVQESWFNTILNQQRIIVENTTSINAAIEEMRLGTRPLKVAIT